MTSFPLRIATRGSPLALAQAEEVRRRLTEAHGLEPGDCEVVVVRTTGDRIVDRPLSQAGGKGLFTREIEEALADGRADIAVHSAKDVPTALPPGMTLSAVLPREDARDAFMSPLAPRFEDLPAGAILGTASLRRGALARRLRPDLEVVTLRGNVATRLDKLARGEVHATLLAMAGLRRLGLAHEATATLDLDSFPPALGQGAIAIETRAADAATNRLVAAIDDGESAAALSCERAFLSVLDGSCRTPIAGYAKVAGGMITFHGMVLSPDGATAFEVRREGISTDAPRMGAAAGEEIVARAGADFLAMLRSHG